MVVGIAILSILRAEDSRAAATAGERESTGIAQDAKATTIAEAMIFRNDGDSVYREITLLTCRFVSTGGSRRCVSAPIKKRLEAVSLDTGKHRRDRIELGTILEPSAERGLAFLQRDYYEADREIDQWMFFPAMKKLKRIISESPNRPKTGSVFGSELSYEDSERLRLDDYHFTHAGEEEIDGRPCDVIEAIPSAARVRKSSYARQRFWVDRQTKTALRRETYDKRSGKLAKTFFSRDLITREGATLAKMEIVVSHQSGRMTMVRVGRWALNVPIDGALFEQRALEDSSFRENFLRPIRAAAR
jgi:hypothetical protein